VIEAHGIVVEAPGAPPTLEPIAVDDPSPGEVRVRVVASGICHSDAWAAEHGNWGAPFPMLLGHEGAGIVDAVGEGVAGLTAGDPVLLAWAVPCGSCVACRRATPRRCAHAWTQPPRMRRATGDVLTGTLAIGSLATHVVVHAAQAIRAPDGADLTRLCLLGCGASTGIGATMNTARPPTDGAVAVIGLGGIGLSALQGARIVGAGRIVAVDVVASKLRHAQALGASDLVDASVIDPVKAVRAATGGVDVAYEATGNASVVAQAVAMLARGGTAVAIGVPAPASTLTLAWGEGAPGAAYPNKATLAITDGGDPVIEDFEAWMRWAVDGTIDLNALVSAEARLTEEDLREAFRAMLAGEVIRTVVQIDRRSAADGLRA
jgi:S-(hydroxymethyl)mycothiol dehydrogenase